MNTNNDLHVVFGAGALGGAVARALARQEKRVRVVSRRGKAAGLLPAVETVAADAYDPEAALQAMQGAAVVYQCAQPPYAEWEQKFPTLQSSILQAAAKAEAKLIIGDNLYMYGAVDGPIHEGLPYAAKTRKGRLRARMAEAALAAHQEGRVRVAIGRASDFFGPHVLSSSMGERVFLPALRGKTASVMGTLDLPHTYTYIDDFGQALTVLGEREQALGQVWHVPNAETLTQRQFLDLVFAEIGRPPKMSAMGRGMLRIGGLFIPEAREAIEMLYEFEQPFVVDDRKYREAFGGQPTSLRTAIRETAAWYREYSGNS